MSTDKIREIRDLIILKAQEFGAKVDEKSSDYIERNNTSGDALDDGGAFFGLIRSDEERTGPYYDFSVAIFPSGTEGLPWLVSLGVGTKGFRNDYELASYPGVRRMYSKLVNGENGFCKLDFTDIESSLPRNFIDNNQLGHLKNTINRYSKYLPVCQVINPNEDKGKEAIIAFIAAYAKLRSWPTNEKHRNAVDQALQAKVCQQFDNSEEIIKLLMERRYIVLQGPPGTGKTFAAKNVAKEVDGTIFFTQFHAETSYSDFIFGIRPDLNQNTLQYTQKLGIFPEAIKYAIENKDKKVVLIIDEINRANLANVLGPIFYLFEYKMSSTDVEIEISPDFKIAQLPENFYVVATMNTADRSLAIIDFALRRRFAWYSMKPQIISSDQFRKSDFSRVAAIFDWYASSTELALQPGQGYFIAANDDEMKNRIRYEVFPLIQEYLLEGMLVNAKDEFNQYFIERIGQSLFE